MIRALTEEEVKSRNKKAINWVKVNIENETYGWRIYNFIIHLQDLIEDIKNEETET
jgi:hypothetical protein